MNRLSELKENRKLDNKGFSLVELIIVIAIMAVLIGVLAPQYLKYVEKSRVASDRDNITAIKDAIQVWGADPDATSALTTTSFDIKRTGTAATTDAIKDALEAAGLPATPPNLTNKQKRSVVTITVTVNSNGTVSVTDNFDTPETTP